jgi:hypothetical protein
VRLKNVAVIGWFKKNFFLKNFEKFPGKIRKPDKSQAFSVYLAQKSTGLYRAL